jgi:hypothetical protein
VSIPATSPVLTRPGDPYLDYCLWPYPSAVQKGEKIRSINLLLQSFDVAGAGAEMAKLCAALREGIGDWRTVWGVKNTGGRLSWEFYFYDYKRLERDVSISRVCDIFRGLTGCDLEFNEDCLYFMFSIDVDNDLVTGRKDLDQLNVYLGDVSDYVSAGICYLFNKDGLRLDNIYHFFDAARDMDAISDKVVSSLHLRLSDFDINRILLPDFLDCKTIVVANKKFNDGIYFSRIIIGQLITFLRKMDYPHDLVAQVETNRARLDHLLYDVGIDYRMENGEIRYLKSSYYGVF